MAKGKVLKLNKDIPSTWEEAMQQFLWFKQAENLSTTTLYDYKRHISQFFNRYPHCYNSPTLKQSLLEYLGQPVKPATYNIRLVYLKAFFSWAVREAILTENPLASFKRKKDEGKIISIDEEILLRLIKLPNQKSYAGLRDYTLILLSLDTGIRPKEAFSLLPSDINNGSLEVYIRKEISKTKTSRTLPIMPVTAKALQMLLSSRHKDWGDTVPVFCTSEGNTLNRHTWGDRLEVYSKALGIKITPYSLRHAFALQFLRNGGHALALQRTLGHTDLTMTKRYVALTQQDIREQHALASPLNTLLPQKHRLRRI